MFWEITLISVLVAMLIAVTILVNDLMKWKHKIIIKELLSHGKKIIHVVKVRELIDNFGNFWILKGEKDPLKRYVGIPPSFAIEHDNKGRKVATMYRDESGAYIWLDDTTEVLGGDKTIKPILTSHRILQKQNIDRANSRGSNFWSKNLPVVIAVSAAVMLVAIALLFTPDVMDSLTGRYNQMESNNKIMIQLVEKIDTMNDGVQQITGITTEINDSNIPD